MHVQPPEPQNSLPSEVPSRPCIKMHRFASLFEFFALRLPDATPPALSLPSGWRFHIHASSSDHFHIFAHSAAVRAMEPNTTGGGLPRTLAQATHQNATLFRFFVRDSMIGHFIAFGSSGMPAFPASRELLLNGRLGVHGNARADGFIRSRGHPTPYHTIVKRIMSGNYLFFFDFFYANVVRVPQGEAAARVSLHCPKARVKISWSRKSARLRF